MSNYCGNIANKYGIKVGVVQKLVPNLGNKSKYGEIVSVQKSLEIKLTKVHRVLKFKYSDWLKN